MRAARRRHIAVARFTLGNVDSSASQARSRGVFELMTSRPGEASVLYMESSFNLRDFEFNGTFLP